MTDDAEVVRHIRLNGTTRRPDGEHARTRPVSVRFAPEEHDALRELAKAHGQSQSDLIRDTMLRLLAGDLADIVAHKRLIADNERMAQRLDAATVKFREQEKAHRAELTALAEQHAARSEWPRDDVRELGERVDAVTATMTALRDDVAAVGRVVRSDVLPLARAAHTEATWRYREMAAWVLIFGASGLLLLVALMGGIGWYLGML